MGHDELKSAWIAHGARLESDAAIDERAVRDRAARGARFALVPYVLCRAAECAVGFAAMYAVVRVLADHAAAPIHWLACGTLGVYVAGLTAMSSHALARALELEVDGSVTEFQRKLALLRLVEQRGLKWAILGGLVVWLPAALVLFEALTGVDAVARADAGWLVGNVVVGVVLALIGRAIAKQLDDGAKRAAWTRRVIEAVSGRTRTLARERIDEVARFERDGPA